MLMRPIITGRNRMRSSAKPASGFLALLSLTLVLVGVFGHSVTILLTLFWLAAVCLVIFFKNRARAKAKRTHLFLPAQLMRRTPERRARLERKPIFIWSGLFLFALIVGLASRAGEISVSELLNYAAMGGLTILMVWAGALATPPRKWGRAYAISLSIKFVICAIISSQAGGGGLFDGGGAAWALFLLPALYGAYVFIRLSRKHRRRRIYAYGALIVWFIQQSLILATAGAAATPLLLLSAHAAMGGFYALGYSRRRKRYKVRQL